MDEAKVVEATGRPFGEWFAILDERGARDMAHKDIARLLSAEYDVPSWWSQSVTVEYEKHMGRRETGQRQTGEYEGSASRTLPGTMDEVLDRWIARVQAGGATPAFDGVEAAGEAGVSRTEKWRYWRVSLIDGSRVTVTISEKPGGGKADRGGRADDPASTIVVTSSKLQAREDGARWKAFWRAYLAGF